MSEFDRLREAAKAVENAKPYSTEYVAAWDVLAGEADATTVLALLGRLEAAEAERDDLRDLMQRQNLMIATTEIRAEEAERKIQTIEALPETCGWVAYDGVKDRGVIYVADLRAALAGDDEADSPSRTHKTAPVSDPGLGSGQGDHRDDEGHSGAQDGSGDV